jgi:hypothetical protein
MRPHAGWQPSTGQEWHKSHSRVAQPAAGYATAAAAAAAVTAHILHTHVLTHVLNVIRSVMCYDMVVTSICAGACRESSTIARQQCLCCRNNKRTCSTLILLRKHCQSLIHNVTPVHYSSNNRACADCKRSLATAASTGMLLMYDTLCSTAHWLALKGDCRQHRASVLQHAAAMRAGTAT